MSGRPTIHVEADFARIDRCAEGLRITTLTGSHVFLCGPDDDSVHRLLNRCHEALVAVPGEPAWTTPWRELVDEYAELAGRLT